MMRPLSALSALALLAFAPSPPARAEDAPAAPAAPAAAEPLMNAASPDAEIKVLVRAGKDLYDRGRYAEAWQKLEKAFEREPSSELALYLRDELGTHVLMKWMREGWESNDPTRVKIADTAKRIYALSEPVLERVRKDPTVIQGYVDGLKGQKFDDVMIAMTHLVNIGPWAIPWLVSNEVLGTEKEETFKTHAIQTLVRMREDAVWPLVEALESKQSLTRQNAAIVLGMIKDERALAALKWAVENPNETPEVKFRAAESLLRISGASKIEDLKTAKEYYYLLAEKYYYSQPSVIRTFGFDWLVWRWNPETDSLTMREAPPFAMNELMAEEACYDGLTIDPEYTPLWGLSACVHASEVVENSLAMKGAGEKIKYELMTQAELDEIKKQTQTFEHGEVLTNLTGPYLYRGLERSLEDGSALVSVAIIRALRGKVRPDELPPPTAGATAPVARAGEQPAANIAAGPPASAAARTRESYAAYPLVKSLIDDDKRVRYAAAETLLHLNPPDRFLGMDAVTVNLIDAVGEMGVRVVLIVHTESSSEDRRDLADLKKKLISLNCFPVVAVTPREGVVKAKSFPSADLIIIQAKLAREKFFEVDLLKKEVSESVWESLRDDVRTRSIPKYLLCENNAEVDASKKIYEDKVWEYVTKPHDRLDLKNRLEKTFASPEAQKDAKTYAEDMAREAAEALAALDPFNTIYPFRDTIRPLIKNLDPEHLRPDPIRIPCVTALGRFGDARAIDILAKLLDDKANAKEVRLPCAKALAEIFRQTHLKPASEIYDILKKNLLDGDVDVEIGCGLALGNADLDNKQRLELEKHRRLHGEKFRAGLKMQEPPK